MENHPRWCGGTVSKEQGYKVVRIPKDSPFLSMCHWYGRKIFEHRLVMAQHLGRCLLSSESVHHINGIRTDNRVENLAIVNHKTHEKHTLQKIQSKRIRDLEEEVARLKSTISSQHIGLLESWENVSIPHISAADCLI